MTFLHPLGLIGLIGVPILILVYILKNRYTEQTIAATYMWRLSERFLKKRNPLSRITGIISLILQILFVISISLALAHPIITLKDAAKEYCFVLDGSASMNMQTSGKSRLDKAKDEICNIIDDAADGSLFSLIYVTDMTETVFELENDKDIIKERIDTLSGSGVSVDFTDSLGVAQRMFNDNPSVITYLVTDTDCSSHTNVRIIDVSSDEFNASFYDISYKDLGSNTYVVNGKASLYGKDMVTADIEVRNNIDDRILGTLRLQLLENTETEFSITFESEKFYSLTVTSTLKDALAGDNTVKVFDIKSENSYTALLVSDTPFLIESALKAVSNAEITVMPTTDYKELEAELALSNKTASGYGLYIYDAFSPSKIPSDGTVWFVGPRENINGSGFSIQGEMVLDEGAEIELNKSSNSLIKKLTDGLMGESIYVKKLMKCGVYGNFSTIFSYMGNPIVFTGEADEGNREVVFAFNMHDTNFSLSTDFPILLHNLLNYSFPDVIERVEYYCGEDAEVNVIPGCTGIRVAPPSGRFFYADTASAVSEIALTEIGEYKITLEFSGNERDFYIFSAVPTAERNPDADALAEYSIRGNAENKGRDGEYDPMTLLFILAALFFTAEWMVYCYDKYQLR